MLFNRALGTGHLCLLGSFKPCRDLCVMTRARGSSPDCLRLHILAIVRGAVRIASSFAVKDTLNKHHLVFSELRKIIKFLNISDLAPHFAGPPNTWSTEIPT